MKQIACDRCAQGVMDGDGPNGPGNDHLYGRCTCSCHAPTDRAAALSGPLNAYLQAEHQLEIAYSAGTPGVAPLRERAHAEAMRAALFAAAQSLIDEAVAEYKADSLAYRNAVAACFPLDPKWTHVSSAADVYTIKQAGDEAVDEAVEQERKRCHKIAVDYASVYMGENTHGDGRRCGEQIAAAIRKIGEGE